MAPIYLYENCNVYLYTYIYTPQTQLVLNSYSTKSNKKVTNEKSYQKKIKLTGMRDRKIREI